MKRTERHHLKENIIRTGVGAFLLFVRKWKREIMIGAAGIAFAAVLFSGLLAVKAYQMRVQSRIAGEILSLSADLKENPDNLARLEALARKGKFAKLGYIELAKHWLIEGDFAKADAYLDKVPKAPRDLLYYQAENLKAQAAVLRKDFDKAISIYRKIEEENPAAYPLDAVLFHLAEAYELKGDVKEARDLYQKLQLEYSQSYYGYESSVKAGRLQLDR